LAAKIPENCARYSLNDEIEHLSQRHILGSTIALKLAVGVLAGIFKMKDIKITHRYKLSCQRFSRKLRSYCCPSESL
jgi:hypothetical protein